MPLFRRAGGVSSHAQLSDVTAWQHHGPPAAVPSFLVFIEDGTVKALNCWTGEVQFSGNDAATVINNALNALTPGRTWREKVVVKGNFTITDTIKIPSYTIFEIQGKLTLADGVNKNVIENSDPANGNTEIVIMGGVVDANKAGQTVANNCIKITKSTYVSVIGVTVQNAYRSSAETANGEGIYFDGCSYGIMANNYALNCDKNGLKVRDLSGDFYHIVIANNVCVGNRDAGIQAAADVSGNSRFVVIIGNTVKAPSELGPSNVTDGIKAHDTDHLIIANNIVEGPGKTLSSRYGIELVGDASYYVVDGNVIYNWYSGIVVQPSNIRSVISNNHIRNCTNGMHIMGGAMRIVGNVIMENTTGILLEVTSSYNRITANSFLANTTHISDAGSNNVIRMNYGYVTENSGTAVGTGEQQAIAHGCSFTPTKAQVIVSNIDDGANPYLSADPDASNIYVTAVSGKAYRWEVRKHP